MCCPFPRLRFCGNALVMAWTFLLFQTVPVGWDCVLVCISHCNCVLCGLQCGRWYFTSTLRHRTAVHVPRSALSQVRFPFSCSQFRCDGWSAQPIQPMFSAWLMDSHVFGESLFGWGLLLDALQCNARCRFLLFAPQNDHAGCRMQHCAAARSWRVFAWLSVLCVGIVDLELFAAHSSYVLFILPISVPGVSRFPLPYSCISFLVGQWGRQCIWARALNALPLACPLTLMLIWVRVWGWPNAYGFCTDARWSGCLCRTSIKLHKTIMQSIAVAVCTSPQGPRTQLDWGWDACPYCIKTYWVGREAQL